MNEYTEISISTIIGEEVFKDNVRLQNTYTINLTDLANGIYTVRLTSGKKSVMQRIIKQQ